MKSYKRGDSIFYLDKRGKIAYSRVRFSLLGSFSYYEVHDEYIESDRVLGHRKGGGFLASWFIGFLFLFSPPFDAR